MMADKDDGDDGFYDDLPDPEDVPDNVIKGVDWHAAKALSKKSTKKVRQLTGTWVDKLLVTAAGDTKPNLANAITILSCDPQWDGCVAFDEFSQAVVIRRSLPSHPTMPRLLRNDDDLFITAWMQRTYEASGSGFSVETVSQAIVAVSKMHAYHPVKEYLRGLTWDGRQRLPTWLTTYCGVEPDDDGYSAAVGTKWMIAAVARVMCPGSKADAMLILEGEQGEGKSTLLRRLASDEWFCDDLGELSSKDAAIQLMGRWIVESAEMDSHTRSEVATIKAFTSRTTDIFRPPYGRKTESFPRQCVFAGTTNQHSYLRDETGNRRFWPVKCGAIDIDAITTDRDQLWAEAVVRYDAGERWHLDTRELRAAAESHADERYQSDPWDEKVQAYMTARRDIGVSVQQILSDVLEIPSHLWKQDHKNRVARILSHARWTPRQVRVGRTRQWVYVPGPKAQV